MNNLEQDERNYLKYVANKFIEPPLLLDVGANKGDYTDEFLKVFPRATCLCFEPIPEIQDIFYSRFKDRNNVNLFRCGLSNIIVDMDIYYIQNGHSGLSSLYDRPVYKDFKSERVKVSLTTIDKSLYYNDLDFIKIDTEGNELNVLLGGEKTIKRKPPKFIQIEYGGCYIDSKTTFRQVLELLNSWGYVVYDRLFQEVKLHSFVENYEYQNFLAEYKGE